MRVPRGSLLLLMAGVAVVALDLGILCALLRDPDSNRARYLVAIDGTRVIAFGGLAMGVLPMSSLLLIATARELPGLAGRGACTGFGLGFLLAGWPAVFAYMAVAATWPAGVHDFLTAALGMVGQPLYKALGPLLPDVVWEPAELVLGGAVLTAPELAVAVLGGWLARRAGRAGGAAGPDVIGVPSPSAIGPLV